MANGISRSGCFIVPLAGGLSACRIGPSDSARRILCLGPGPGMGHQALHGMRHCRPPNSSYFLLNYPGFQGVAIPSNAQDYMICLARAAEQFDVLLGLSWGAILALHLSAVGNHQAILINPARTVAESNVPVGGGPRLTQVRKGRNMTPDAWFRQHLAEVGLHAAFDSDRHIQDFLQSVETSYAAWSAGRQVTRLLATRETLRQHPAVIRGDRDTICHPRDAPGAILVAGRHYLHLDNPDGLLLAIREVLQVDRPKLSTNHKPAL